jgi:hypothetical protein
VKLVAQFDKFLKEEVNLNKTRITTLTDRVDAIQDFIRGSDWKPSVLRFSPQGSWAHKTIIKPPGSRGFDADVLVFIQHGRGDPVNRRTFIAGFGSTAAWPLLAGAQQQPERMRRIGVLMGGDEKDPVRKTQSLKIF